MLTVFDFVRKVEGFFETMSIRRKHLSRRRQSARERRHAVAQAIAR
jgi:hypothetical protein